MADESAKGDTTMTDADLPPAIVASAIAEVQRLTEEVRIRDVHIEALKEMLKKRNATIAQLRLELARFTKGV